MQPAPGKTSDKVSRKVRLASLTFLGMLAATAAMADEFYLSSGKVVRGALASESDTEYVLQTEIGTIKVSKAEVVRTVEQGTTPAEIEGDVAATKGDINLAITRYRQALQAAAVGGLAADRLQGKITKLSTASQQAASAGIINDYNQAQSLITARQFDSAQAILERIEPMVSPSDPLSSSVRQLRANLHYGKGMGNLDTAKVEAARRELELAIAADPSFYPAYISLGQSLLENSATVSRGIEFMEKGISAAGDRLTEQQRYAYQYELAGKYFDQRNYAQAAAMYSELIPARERYPAYADALDKAVEAYVRMSEESMGLDFRETIENLNVALRLNPSNQKALFLLGRIYLDIGQIENAIISLSKLVQIAPKYEEANHYLGRAYFQIRDYDQALTYLTNEIDAHPDTYFGLVDRAEVHIALGNYTAAEADLTAARALDREHWLAYYLTGLLAYKQKNYDAARKALMDGLEKKRNAMPIHLLMGQVLMEQNQVDGARQWFEQVADNLASAENLSYQYRVYRAEALSYLGQIAITQNSPRQAVNYLTQALEAVPEYAPAMVAMADANLLLATDASANRSREQLYKEAEELYLKAISKDPENPEFYLQMGRFYHRYQTDYPKAQEYYNLYVDKGGTDNRLNTWLVEVGGTAREELVTTAPATVSTGTMTTTGTAVIGAPTLAMSMPATTTSTVTATTETVGVMPAMPQSPGAPGAPAPVAPPPQ